MYVYLATGCRDRTGNQDSLTQGSRFPGRNVNPEPVKYVSAVLTIGPASRPENSPTTSSFIRDRVRKYIKKI